MKLDHPKSSFWGKRVTLSENAKAVARCLHKRIKMITTKILLWMQLQNQSIASITLITHSIGSITESRNDRSNVVIAFEDLFRKDLQKHNKIAKLSAKSNHKRYISGFPGERIAIHILVLLSITASDNTY